MSNMVRNKVYHKITERLPNQKMNCAFRDLLSPVLSTQINVCNKNHEES